MRKFNSQTRLGIALVILSSFLVSCATQASNKYYGVTEAPKGQVLRYVSGSEPESLDPQVPTGQPEARVLMALYDGLVEYHPKTMEAIPGIAESWETSQDGTEYIFHLRKDAKFSNGEQIKAKDFVYTFRRGFSPELAAQNAYLGYYIKYSEAYNAGKSFVKKADGTYLLKSETEEKKEEKPAEKKDEAKADDKTKTEEKPEAKSEEVKPAEPEKKAEEAKAAETEKKPTEEVKPDNFGADTEFHKYIDSPERYTADGDPLGLAKAMEGNEVIKNEFKFRTTDVKDGFAKKVKDGTDAFAKYLQTNLNQDALNACATGTCSEENKKTLADSLNTLLDKEAFYSPERFSGIKLLERSEGVLKHIEDENKKADEENAKIDEEIKALKTPEEKAEKEKKKKKKIEKLFYVNRVLLEDVYENSLGKAPLEAITGEHIGVEAIDDQTFRIKLYQPAPFFIGLLGHQFFRVVHEATIKKYGDHHWTKPQNIVTSGAFKLVERNPYQDVIVEKDPNYWDAKNVKLDRIEFYPLEEATTMMNLYKTGDIDAIYNHTPPAAWNEEVSKYKDEYLNFPEVANEYYTFNVRKGIVKDPNIRKAFALAVNRVALSKYRKVTKPLADWTPEGIFPKYEEARQKVFTEKLKAQGSSLEEWKARIFDNKMACDIFKEAGFKVTNGDKDRCKVETKKGAEGRFPIEEVELLYNTSESNKDVAEFIQAQWKQNLGIEVQLKNMEWKTFLKVRKDLDYTGMGRAGWVGDYMDPFTFLNLFYSENNDSSTGWFDPKFDKMLDDANKELDEMKRFEKLAEAEFFMMQEQPVLPLSTNATNWIKKPYVKGLYPNPGTLHAWKFVYIEHDESKWDKNVVDIMNQKDAWVEEQISRLTKSQEDFKNSKTNEEKPAVKTATAE